jgi:group I intron endonuclease
MRPFSTGNIKLEPLNLEWLDVFDPNSDKYLSTPVEIITDIANIKSELAIYHKKVDIYLWHNNITGDQYVGSGINLRVMVGRYFQNYYLIKNRKITNSLKKYGHSSFTLVILEVCGEIGSVSQIQIIAREPYNIDLYIPTLNILKYANSSLGYTHSPEMIDKLSEIHSLMYKNGKRKIFSPEFLALQKKDRRGCNNPQFGVKKRRPLY